VSRVLLVQDNDRLRSEICSALHTRSHTVHESTIAGFDADAAREFDPEIVLIDFASNGSSAPVRLAMLRDPQLRHLPMIALTASLEQARAYGANAYLPGPVDANLVAPLLEVVLRQVQA
jgi:CheY-like chemotaxis protein